MTTNEKWAAGIAAALGVTGVVLVGVLVAQMVLGALAAFNGFVHAFDGAVSF